MESKNNNEDELEDRMVTVEQKMDCLIKLVQGTAGQEEGRGYVPCHNMDADSMADEQIDGLTRCIKELERIVLD